MTRTQLISIPRPCSIRFVTSLAIPFFVWMGSISAVQAQGNTNLKQIKVHENGEVNLIFDRVLKGSQISVEYLNEILQLTLTDVVVYPAKILPVSNGHILTKIFAYQYSPKTVRCRFTIKGNAEDFKDRFEIVPDGKTVRLKFEAIPVVKAADQKAGLKTAESGADAQHDSADRDQTQDQDLADEKQILQKVLSGGRSNPKTVPVLEEKIPSAEKPVLTGAKPLPSLGLPLAKVGGVILLLGLITLIMKRMKGSKNKASSGLIAKLSRLAKGDGKSGKVIEMVSSYHLDPKKSIAVVRVGGRMLVLGVSNDAINLITQMNENVTDSDPGKYADAFDEKDDAKFPESFDGIGKAAESFLGKGSHTSSSFSDLFDSERLKPSSSEIPPLHLGTRSRIRSRLEGLKPL